MVYGIFTAGQRTWGGPRADAGQADEVVSPREVVEYAQTNGDDLNLIPESFRPAVEARARGKTQSPTTAPQSQMSLDERLTPSIRDTGSWRGVSEDSIVPFRQGFTPLAAAPRLPLHPRASISMESLAPSSSLNYAPYGSPLQLAYSDGGDLEAGNMARRSRAHPPIAPSARFESRLLQLSSEADGGSNNDLVAVAQLPRERDFNTNIAVAESSDQVGPHTAPWSVRPSESFVSWRSFSSPASDPFESAEVLLEHQAQQISSDPFYGSTEVENTFPHKGEDGKHVMRPSAAVRAPMAPSQQSMVGTEGSNVSVVRSTKKSKRLQKKGRTLS